MSSQHTLQEACQHSDWPLVCKVTGAVLGVENRWPKTDEVSQRYNACLKRSKTEPDDKAVSLARRNCKLDARIESIDKIQEEARRAYVAGADTMPSVISAEGDRVFTIKRWGARIGDTHSTKFAAEMAQQMETAMFKFGAHSDDHARYIAETQHAKFVQFAQVADGMIAVHGRDKAAAMLFDTPTTTSGVLQPTKQAEAAAATTSSKVPKVDKVKQMAINTSSRFIKPVLEQTKDKEVNVPLFQADLHLKQERINANLVADMRRRLDHNEFDVADIQQAQQSLLDDAKSCTPSWTSDQVHSVVGAAHGLSHVLQRLDAMTPATTRIVNSTVDVLGGCALMCAATGPLGIASAAFMILGGLSSLFDDSADKQAADANAQLLQHVLAVLAEHGRKLDTLVYQLNMVQQMQFQQLRTLATQTTLLNHHTALQRSMLIMLHTNTEMLDTLHKRLQSIQTQAADASYDALVTRSIRPVHLLLNRSACNTNWFDELLAAIVVGTEEISSHRSGNTSQVHSDMFAPTGVPIAHMWEYLSVALLTVCTSVLAAPHPAIVPCHADLLRIRDVVDAGRRLVEFGKSDQRDAVQELKRALLTSKLSVFYVEEKERLVAQALAMARGRLAEKRAVLMHKFQQQEVPDVNVDCCQYFGGGSRIYWFSGEIWYTDWHNCKSWCYYYCKLDTDKALCNPGTTRIVESPTSKRWVFPQSDHLAQAVVNYKRQQTEQFAKQKTSVLASGGEDDDADYVEQVDYMTPDRAGGRWYDYRYLPILPVPSAAKKLLLPPDSHDMKSVMCDLMHPVWTYTLNVVAETITIQMWLVSNVAGARQLHTDRYLRASATWDKFEYGCYLNPNFESVWKAFFGGHMPWSGAISVTNFNYWNNARDFSCSNVGGSYAAPIHETRPPFNFDAPPVLVNKEAPWKDSQELWNLQQDHEADIAKKAWQTTMQVHQKELEALGDMLRSVGAWLAVRRDAEPDLHSCLSARLCTDTVYEMNRSVLHVHQWICNECATVTVPKRLERIEHLVNRLQRLVDILEPTATEQRVVVDDANALLLKSLYKNMCARFGDEEARKVLVATMQDCAAILPASSSSATSLHILSG